MPPRRVSSLLVALLCFGPLACGGASSAHFWSCVSRPPAPRPGADTVVFLVPPPSNQQRDIYEVEVGPGGDIVRGEALSELPILGLRDGKTYTFQARGRDFVEPLTVVPVPRPPRYDVRIVPRDDLDHVVKATQQGHFLGVEAGSGDDLIRVSLRLSENAEIASFRQEVRRDQLAEIAGKMRWYHPAIVTHSAASSLETAFVVAAALGRGTELGGKQGDRKVYFTDAPRFPEKPRKPLPDPAAAVEKAKLAPKLEVGKFFTVSGRVAHEKVRAPFVDRLPSLRACFDPGGVVPPRFALRFVLDWEGRAHPSSRVPDPSFLSLPTTVRACLEDVVSALPFPAAERDAGSVDDSIATVVAVFGSTP